MKILFNNKIFFDQKYGGISRYFTTIFDTLIKKDITFKVIAPIYKNIFLKNLDNSFKKGIFIPRYPLNLNLERLNNYISKPVDFNYTNCDGMFIMLNVNKNNEIWYNIGLFASFIYMFASYISAPGP